MSPKRFRLRRNPTRSVRRKRGPSAPISIGKIPQTRAPRTASANSGDNATPPLVSYRIRRYYHENSRRIADSFLIDCHDGPASSCDWRDGAFGTPRGATARRTRKESETLIAQTVAKRRCIDPTGGCLRRFRECSRRQVTGDTGGRLSSVSGLVWVHSKVETLRSLCKEH